jgi:hypothetical protein
MMRTWIRVLVIGLVLSLAVPAWAAPPVTETNTVKGGTETFVDTPFCEPGATHEITATFNLVEHSTMFDDGRVHFTFTQTGTFEAEPLDPDGQAASGHFTVWGGFNDNGKTVNGTFTFNVNGSFEDGSKISVHAVDHFNVTPDGTEFFFSKCKE